MGQITSTASRSPAAARPCWADAAFAAWDRQQDMDEAAAEAAEAELAETVLRALEDIACSDLDQQHQPVDDIGEHLLPALGDDDESPDAYMRRALRWAAAGMAKRLQHGNDGGAFSAAGEALAKALEMACYRRAEQEAR